MKLNKAVTYPAPKSEYDTARISIQDQFDSKTRDLSATPSYHLIIHHTTKYFMSTCYVPGALLGAGGMEMDKAGVRLYTQKTELIH